MTLDALNVLGVSEKLLIVSVPIFPILARVALLFIHGMSLATWLPLKATSPNQDVRFLLV